MDKKMAAKRIPAAFVAFIVAPRGFLYFPTAHSPDAGVAEPARTSSIDNRT
jgi:hypothetical protein